MVLTVYWDTTGTSGWIQYSSVTIVSNAENGAASVSNQTSPQIGTIDEDESLRGGASSGNRMARIVGT